VAEYLGASCVELPPHVAGFDSNGEACDQVYLDGSDQEVPS
jgi:hypothetical protein